MACDNANSLPVDGCAEPGYVFLAMSKVKSTLRAVDEFQQQHAWLAFPVAVWKKFGDDQAGNLALLVAWFAFVSIFPLMLVLVTVLDIVLKNNPDLQHRLLNSALSQYPLIGQQLGHIGRIHESGLALVIGLVGTFLGARGVANAMQNALNTVWEIPYARRPGFPWAFLRSLGQIIVIGLGLIGTTVLSTMAGGAGHLLTGFGATVAALLVSLVLNIGFFWLAFRLGTASATPSARRKPRASVVLPAPSSPLRYRTASAASASGRAPASRLPRSSVSSALRACMRIGTLRD